MKDRHPLRIPVLLLLASFAGFIGLFVFEGIWDAAFFALAILPLVAAVAVRWRLRRSTVG